MELLGIKITKTPKGRYVVKYGGETFNFGYNFNQAAEWVRRIREHEASQGFKRTEHGLEPKEEE